MMKKRLLPLPIACLLAFLLLASTACRKEARLQKIIGFAQGSYYAVSYFAPAKGSTAAENLQSGIDSLLSAFDLCASLWNDSSEICRVNRNEDFEASAMFQDLFQKSQWIAQRTNGVFDITVSPLVKRYGFSKSQDTTPATGNLPEKERKEILQYVGWKKVRLQGGKIEKDHPLLQLDFNAIAQGYSAGIVARFLESRGIDAYLVDVGGEICAKGEKPDGSPWVVGIEKPARTADAERMLYKKMHLKDKSLVTSGNYRKYFEEGGKRYSHTIDPRNGEPARNNLLSATILCEECWEADAIATACMVWGVDSSQAFLGRHPGRYEAFLIFADSIPGTDSIRLASWQTDGFPIID